MEHFQEGFKIEKCLNKTTSQANSKLVYFYEFKKIYIDGVILQCNSSFGLYVKEETDEMIINNKGERVPNTHLGRQKLHYPISLYFKSSQISSITLVAIASELCLILPFSTVDRFLWINFMPSSFTFDTSCSINSQPS